METVNKEFLGFDLLPNEQWSFIPSINHKYIISTCGRVASFIRGAYRIRPTFVTGSGYLQVAFSEKGKRTMYYVHRIVGLAFIPNPNNLHYINHKDENKTNNHADNLEWCTAKYNLEYSGITQKWRAAGTKASALMRKLNPIHPIREPYIREKLYRFKLRHRNDTVYSYNKDGQMSSFKGFKEYANFLKCDIQTVARICFYNYYLNTLEYEIGGNYPSVSYLKKPDFGV